MSWGDRAESLGRPRWLEVTRQSTGEKRALRENFKDLQTVPLDFLSEYSSEYGPSKMISRNSVWCSHSIGNSAFFLYPQWKTARFTWHLVLYPEVFASVMRLISHSWNISVLLPDKNKILKARSKKIKSFPSILTSQDKAQEYLQEHFLSYSALYWRL